MATAQTIIKRAMRLIGATGSGETPTTDELADGLEALNAMLDSWRNERLMVYANTEVNLTLTALDNSYTIGTGGNFNTTRPLRIIDAFYRQSNIDIPIRIIEVDEWNRIPDKTLTGDYVKFIYYNPSMATGTVQVYPTPSAAIALYLTLETPLDAFASLATSVSLPPGYERALAYNLSIEIAPEFGKEASPTVANIANESKAGIKRVNSRPIAGASDLFNVFGKQHSNILIGE